MGNKCLWISFLNIFMQLRVQARIDGQVLDLQPTGYDNLSQYVFIVYDKKNIMIISYLSSYATYCTKKAWNKCKISHITVQLVFSYLIKPVWQVAAYLEITFWWKILISPWCSSPLTYRSTSNSYLNVGIKLFCFVL